MAHYAVVNPATGSVVKDYPTIGDADLDSALARAHAARWRQVWTSTVPDHASDQQLLLVEFSAAIYEYYADNAETFLADEPIELLAGEGSALIRRSPVGVLLGIMPWNFPYYQVARFAGPNLIIGNTVLLKHTKMAQMANNTDDRQGSRCKQ